MDLVLVPRLDEAALERCGQRLAEVVAAAVADGMAAGIEMAGPEHDVAHDAEYAPDGGNAPEVGGRAAGAPDPADVGSPGAERQTRGGAPA